MELDLSDLGTKCRICLTENDGMHKIYADFDSGITLDEILTDTTGIQNDKNDVFSAYLCQNCTTIIVEFYNLKTIYRENQRQINDMLENEKIEETDLNESIKLEVEGNEILNEEINLVLEPSEEEETVEEYQQVIKYTCPHCTDSFLQEDDIRNHLAISHNLIDVNCDNLCETSLIQLTTNTNSPVKCKICSLDFPNQEKYKKHMEIHKKFSCSICDAAFLKKSYLKDHTEIHMKERKHVCSFCNKAFQRRTVLIKHKKIHTHPRQCICEICGNAFNDRGTLKTHILLKHTKARNFHCGICGLKFSLKSTLDKHVRRHDNKEREFVCKFCPAAYKDKSSLDRHVIVKHNNQHLSVSCEDCGRNYVNVGNLMKHRKSCHWLIKDEFEDEYIEETTQNIEEV